MNRNLGIVLLIWNASLSLLLGWVLLRKPAHASGEAGLEATPTLGSIPAVRTERDSLSDGPLHIAFFFMDSVQKKFELVKEKGEHFRREGQRLQNNLQSELGKAQKRYDELMAKDHTYSTNAEMEADQRELQDLVSRIQGLQGQSEQRMQDLEVKMLSEISQEIMDFLEDYNRTSGYDYIFSVQSGGQIWVGNKDLDITPQVVEGLNARHRSVKADGAAQER
ncbi:MAG: OmpH family outer membrane protein [Flavobacteriales bacterium]|nr:OmpH family outer membrane protein [Flavobacteriales bacterium]MCB9166278.1 OmpH family outer membrane protein [Flavobacteriales bacterium]